LFWYTRSMSKGQTLLPVLAFLLVFGAPIAKADVDETFNFSGTLDKRGANSVTGSFTLDITMASITAFDFMTPIAIINPSEGFTATVNQVTDTSGDNFVYLDFENTVYEQLLRLAFETTLSAFPGSGFYTGAVDTFTGGFQSELCGNASGDPVCGATDTYFFSSGSASPVTVPEPGSILLLSAAVAILGLSSKQRVSAAA
jgi:hypothetical protein